MIKEVSSDQWQQCLQVVPSTLNDIAKPTDRAAQTEAVKLLYENAGKNMPRIIFSDSPWQAMVIAAFLRGANLRDNLGDNLRANLGDNLWDNLWDNLRDNLGDNLRANLGDNLWDNLRDNLWANLGDNLRANLGDNLWDNLRDNLGDNLRDNLWDIYRETMFFYWHKAHLGYLQGGEICGHGHDAKKWDVYKKITQNLDSVFPYENLCIVCDHPVECHWSDRGLGLHNDSGMAIQWHDGYGLWMIDGYQVPEALVMHPELQTLDDINAEKNAEIKRIRINKFGWSRYLSESNAILLDTNLTGYAWETLIACDGYKVLCTYDPSTGRPYALEVDIACTTCEEAQRYLLAPNEVCGLLGIDATKVKTYPILRT
jgi:hypothetical protein